MNGFERRKERKKQNILHAALHLFSDYGVQKVSIQEIAKRAQVSQVTIYNYFGSKDQLLYHTVEMLIYKRLESSRSIIDDESLSFKEKMKSLITSKKQDVTEYHTEFIQSILSEQPDIQKLLHDFNENHTIPLLMKLVNEGKEEGLVHQELSFETISFFVNMYYQAFHSLPTSQKESISGFSEELIHLFFYGIMGNTDQPIRSKQEE
ncbi:TetR/AcrR family transcriptional regulator [Halobacillus litoralis]|uniref:TetR/AcrR family transcriptional regulator n=1 Tax=Halobacillus litoralis TaxID=45668 RepID=UPI001CD7E673|nr:TetR/AcrR family transcriptional regulator [Halobacillus litoralis]MCA0969737.1 TetR/AcrR family transcriptional regulator [Halobacillus litoralis]